VTSIIAIGIFQIPTLVRVTRGSANAIWAREFVLAARASGRGGFRITIEHVLPNVLPILIVQATIQFALAILAEAALSYLGLGTQPPQPSWGRMLNDAQTLLFQSPMLAVYRALRSQSPCLASICSETGCAICSIPGWRGSVEHERVR
jgi:peptide/nickel transport system permease protein